MTVLVKIYEKFSKETEVKYTVVTLYGEKKWKKCPQLKILITEQEKSDQRPSSDWGIVYLGADKVSIRE